MLRIILICCLLIPLNVAAQEYDSIAAEHPQESAPVSLLTRFRQLQHFLDSTSMGSVNPHYIEVPKQPWRFMLRYSENAVEVDYLNRYQSPNPSEYSDWKLSFMPPAASSIGFWVGYRGTGLSYTFSINKNAGRLFSFGTTGAMYGLNFRLRRFSITETTLTGTDYEDGKSEDFSLTGSTYKPVWIRSAYVNGYYVFNGRRYSQAAAYNQSFIQRRSAGSFLLGATLRQSSFDYSDKDNALFILGSHNIGRIKLHQVDIGIGYGYNLVPFRGLVINAMIMPNVSVYNRVKVYKYDCNYELSSSKGSTDDYGQWNSETRTWANGKKHKPFSADDQDGSWLDKIEIWDAGTATEYGMMRLSLDMRLGLAYNWKNYFLSLQAQLNQLSYKKGDSKVSIVDAFAQMNVGVRF